MLLLVAACLVALARCLVVGWFVLFDFGYYVGCFGLWLGFSIRLPVEFVLYLLLCDGY